MEGQLTRTLTWLEPITAVHLACSRNSKPRAVRMLLSSLPPGRQAGATPIGQRRIGHQQLHVQQAKGHERRTRRSLSCRAALADDLPLVLIIGASVLYSAAPLLLPLEVSPKPRREEDQGLFGKGNVRNAAMGIISVIPIFNWLAWVFAWLDTSDQRYLVFATIYVAPYIRMEFFSGSKDSWLPLLSVLFCIAHVQIDGLANSETPPEPLLKGLQRLKLPDLPSRPFEELKERVEETLQELERPLQEAERRKEKESAAQQRQEEEEAEALRRREREAKEELRRWDAEFLSKEKTSKEPPHDSSSGAKEKV